MTSSLSIATTESPLVFHAKEKAIRGLENLTKSEKLQLNKNNDND